MDGENMSDCNDCEQYVKYAKHRKTCESTRAWSISIKRGLVGLGLITLGAISGYLIGQSTGFRQGKLESEIRSELVDEFHRRYYGRVLNNEEMRNANRSTVAEEHYIGQLEAFVDGIVPEKPFYNSQEHLQQLAEEGKKIKQERFGH